MPLLCSCFRTKYTSSFDKLGVCQDMLHFYFTYLKARLAVAMYKIAASLEISYQKDRQK